MEVFASGDIQVNEKPTTGGEQVFNYSQAVLKALLMLKNTNPGALSASEKQIADRVCLCTECMYYWIRNEKNIPRRCPHCHKRNWDRPTLAMLVSTDRTTTLVAAAQAAEKAKAGGA